MVRFNVMARHPSQLLAMKAYFGSRIRVTDRFAAHDWNVVIDDDREVDAFTTWCEVFGVKR